MEYLILIIYSSSLLFIFLFSLGQLHLTLQYLKSKKKSRELSLVEDGIQEDKLPAVTVQLPIYNEKYVVERLIDTIACFEYPLDKMEIQILDDSTDETVDLIAKKVQYYQEKGIDIQHIRRPDRVGFKAGALEYGLDIAKGEFIAIFDADFLPRPDFLKLTVPYFLEDENIGVVQTRWGHVNKDYSILTKLQAFGLDAHFTIEQVGRSAAGSFINFNGTGGVWRKKCIYDAGNWQPDTLTEDLDLSYRAQMKGWRFKYLEKVESPAELPVYMPAIKSQQFRWNKGAAESAKKHLGTVLKSGISFPSKVHAFFHLLNSSVFLFLLIAALFSIPMLFVKYAHPELNWLINIGGILLVGFFSISFFYWVATKEFVPQNTFGYYIKVFPMFLMISMGLSLHNSIAVLEGFLGFKSPFVRTPKFNIQQVSDSWKGNIYIKQNFSWLNILEGLLVLYFLAGIGIGFYFNDFGLIIFHIMLAIGFGNVFFYSMKTTG
ncbi:cellulose synthase family protein [Flexithrix dorotheae]|uniref:cellulose synthase family protein n=1 Tax=Flexithrix dorotheae TaxID=70993 RepID=UPI0003746979|nr:cellulose synthase family protein [Flexithrix dorotheae]